MATITIEEQEWWPVLACRSVEDGSQRYGDELEVNDDVLNEWHKAFQAFRDVQGEIRKVMEHADYVRNLPKIWWSIVIRTGTTYERYGFHGNKIQSAEECERARKEHVDCVVDLFKASNKHALEYQRLKEHLNNKQDHHDQIQEDLSL